MTYYQQRLIGQHGDIALPAVVRPASQIAHTHTSAQRLAQRSLARRIAFIVGALIEMAILVFVLSFEAGVGYDGRHTPMPAPAPSHGIPSSGLAVR